tara:strand:- start:523 stop:1443 length:921 start_codon:yes stop_codon:yes gene_type:complete
MKRASKSQFESGYGFKSPGFTVDTEGNLSATSLNIVQAVAEGVYDFVVTETDNTNFIIQNYVGNNPTITLSRGKQYSFQLSLTNFAFYIKQSDGTTNQTAGISHSSGDIGEEAQGKTSGIISFLVPANADDTLYYENATGTTVGTITVVDPEGLFSDVSITATTNSTSSTTGTLIAAGGVGIAKDLYVGGSLNIDGVGISKIDSLTNLELGAANKIILKIDDIIIGTLNSEGLTTTLNNSNITASTITTSTMTSSAINSTTIGLSTPSSAKFTAAELTAAPVNNNDATNKKYVDTIVTALSIALGS